MKPLRGCLQEDSHVYSACGSLLKLRAYSEAYCREITDPSNGEINILENHLGVDKTQTYIPFNVWFNAWTLDVAK